MTKQKYLDLEQQQIVPKIRKLSGKNCNETRFQQDGCPAIGILKEYVSKKNHK